MITWFADYHAAIMVFMGKILNIKAVIIAGGQESVCYPELKKGVYYKKIQRSICQICPSPCRSDHSES